MWVPGEEPLLRISEASRFAGLWSIIKSLRGVYLAA